jgi:conserved oligomeric Golgi complex subunit 3
LDFSDAGKAVSRFLANRNRQLFSMSTENALVTLLREGVSVQEESVDSKRDLEDALRSACNDFIEHTCKSIAGGILELVDQCQKFSPADKLNEQKFLQADKVKAMLVQVSERLEVQVGEVSSQMQLYLDNPATQSILLKPISRKITKALEECRKYISQTKDGVNGWDETNRGEMFMLVDDIDKGVKKSTKASR